MGEILKLKVVSIITLVFASLLFGVLQLISPVKADQGSAKVYILKLDGVSACWVDDQSDAVEGAIKACTPSERHYRVPEAHPKYGGTPPYYSISYQVITYWSTYVDLILNEVGVIILNTHGEILPVPNGYDEWQWVDAIADAMINRRVTWAHMACYPFYHVWHQGDMEMSLFGGVDGKDGFKALMSHIGLYDVELPIDTLPSNYTADLTGWADQVLDKPSWDLTNAGKVRLKRPLPKSVFKNYIALPIYDIDCEGETWWEGAVINFAKSGERLNLEGTHGFGAFVHLGTDQTYTYSDSEATNRDFWRAYVATAAAIWTETTRFEDATDFVEGEGAYGTVYTALRVAPVITDYWWEENELVVRIVLGIYGALKAHKDDTEHYIWDIPNYPIYVQVNGTPGDWELKAQLDVSRNAKNWNHTITNLWMDECNLIGSAITWVGPALWPEAEALFFTLEGLILFSDWLQTLDGRYGASHTGVTERASEVAFSYLPEIKETTSGGCRHEEFQSLIAIDLYVPKGEIIDWRVIPLDFFVRLNTWDNVDAEVGPAGLSVAVWLDDSDEVSVFFEDFEDGMDSWSTEDRNPSAGLDYWGISTSIPYIARTQIAWCAQEGTNSLNGDIPNEEAEKYDKDMDAWLIHDVDLRPYQWANLSYYVDFMIKAGDYLKVYYKIGDHWFPSDKTYSGWDWFWDRMPVPTNAEKIGFQFYSNGDSDICTGASLDHIEIRAKLHNDPPYDNTDAGNTFSNPNSIFVYESWTNYAGYLGAVDDTQDWYTFTVGSGLGIEVRLTVPPEADFNIELYDKYENKKAGPADAISYTLSPSDPADGWRIKIYTASGSGQYDFDIIVPPSLTVLAEDQYGNPLTSGDVYIDDELVGYTGSTFPVVPRTHKVFVNDFWESNNTGYRYGFENWADGSVDNPRNITVVEDTTITACFIKKWCPGDVNGDCKVDMKDITFVILHFGAFWGHPDWDSRADLNRDNKIDMKDQVIVILNFGNRY